MGLSTGLDVAALIALSLSLPVLLGLEVPGQVVIAGRTLYLHPLPATTAARA